MTFLNFALFLCMAGLVLWAALRLAKQTGSKNERIKVYEEKDDFEHKARLARDKLRTDPSKSFRVREKFTRE